MKNIWIVFLLMTALCSEVEAQTSKMRIDGKPEKLTNEMVGVRDVNGRICAALQVISDMDGFKYDSYNGVVRVDDEPGRDMVFLSPDERVVEVFKTGYEPLKMILSEYGIQLNAKEVWKIKIVGDAKTGDALPVTFLTEPKDAEIKIDGNAVRSGTPIKLSKGKHEMLIAKQGFKTIKKVVTVDEKHVLFNAALEPVELQEVVFKSEPAEAAIFLDGVEKGATNEGLYLFPGEYGLKLIKEGYLEVGERITITEGRKNEFFYKLVKNSGTLSLSVMPADATIFINGKKTEKRRPELLPGDYDIRVFKSGYVEKREKLRIERGKTLRKTYVLEKNSGTLILSITPAAAEVLINREDYSGRNRVELAPGSYKLEISKDGYEGVTETLNLKRGQRLPKTYRLKEKTGKLFFSIKPLTARVSLKRNGKTLQNWTGMKKLDLQVGQYELECLSGGYAGETREVVIRKGKTEIVKVRMKKSAVSDREPRNASPGRKGLTGKGFEMVFVEGGTFTMGRRSVTVSDFYIGKYEVTQKEWKAVMGNNPSRFKGDDRPVERVSWYDAVEFCNAKSRKEGLSECYRIEKNVKDENNESKYDKKKWKVTCDFSAKGYRLPTEAEWEYAARGGAKSRGYKYAGSNNIDEVAEYEGNNDKETKPVGGKNPNELGIYDMSGNVWEWCSDWYGSYGSGSVSNPTGPSSGSYRVGRGGSWFNDASSCRVAYRSNSGTPANSGSGLGFRLVSPR